MEPFCLTFSLQLTTVCIINFQRKFNWSPPFGKSRSLIKRRCHRTVPQLIGMPTTCECRHRRHFAFHYLCSELIIFLRRREDEVASWFIDYFAVPSGERVNQSSRCFMVYKICNLFIRGKYPFNGAGH